MAGARGGWRGARHSERGALPGVWRLGAAALLAAAGVSGAWCAGGAGTGSAARSAGAAGRCGALSFEAEVARGEAYTHALTPALDFKLEAVPAGWMVRVLPHNGPRPPHDAAELANPPYRSPTPILISTDFAFRAQDAIAWNPRRFRYFTTPAEVAGAEAAYQATLRDPTHPAAGAALFPLLAHAGEATLTILDAQIAGGSANQNGAAAAVATHLDTTAHTVHTEVATTPLGAVLRLRFRVIVDATPTCR